MLNLMINKITVLSVLAIWFSFSSIGKCNNTEPKNIAIIENIGISNQIFYITNWNTLKLLEYSIIEGERSPRPRRVTEFKISKTLSKKIKSLLLEKKSILNSEQPSNINNLRSVILISKKADNFILNQRATIKLNLFLAEAQK